MASTVETLTEILGFAPVWPAIKEIDGSRLLFGYNDAADTLYVHFFDRKQPTVSVDIDECVYLLINRPTQRVVGLQIEGFLIRAVREHPDWLPLAELAGIPAEDIEKARTVIDIEQRREAVVLPILKQLQLLAS